MVSVRRGQQWHGAELARSGFKPPVCQLAFVFYQTRQSWLQRSPRPPLSGHADIPGWIVQLVKSLWQRWGRSSGLLRPHPERSLLFPKCPGKSQDQIRNYYFHHKKFNDNFLVFSDRKLKCFSFERSSSPPLLGTENQRIFTSKPDFFLVWAESMLPNQSLTIFAESEPELFQMYSRQKKRKKKAQFLTRPTFHSKSQQRRQFSLFPSPLPPAPSAVRRKHGAVPAAPLWVVGCWVVGRWVSIPSCLTCSRFTSLSLLGLGSSAAPCLHRAVGEHHRALLQDMVGPAQAGWLGLTPNLSEGLGREFFCIHLTFKGSWTIFGVLLQSLCGNSEQDLEQIRQ